jgi:hypothetical protein
MRLKTLTVTTILLVGLAACGNDEPAKATNAVATDVIAPTNAVGEPAAMNATIAEPRTSNAVADPAASTTFPADKDDPRSLPDRRAPKAEGGEGSTEPK